MLHKDVTIKSYPPNTDLSSRCIPIHAHDLKNGQWCLDDKTGIPGTVCDLKFSKTGKHGHAKFTYKLRMPHSGRASSAMHPGGDHLTRPVMEKTEYLVSHYDKNSEELSCLDEDFEEIFFKLSKTREEVHKKVTECIENGQNEGKDVYVTVLEGPKKLGDKIEILQIVTEAKAVNPE